MNGRAQQGFTLMEVLLATTLLAMGLAVAFATLRSATAVTGRGEAVARESERMRMTDGFLRRRLSGALPVSMDTDPLQQTPVRFLGEPGRMRFVADLPAYLGRGGPHLHDLSVDAEGDAVALRISFAMVQGGRVVEETPPRPQETLVDGLRSVRFRYRGLDAQGALGEWQEAWETAAFLPLQVSVEIEGADGQAWPPLIVGLPQSGGGHGVAGGGH